MIDTGKPVDFFPSLDGPQGRQEMPTLLVPDGLGSAFVEF